jgi:hypothetical protein
LKEEKEDMKRGGGEREEIIEYVEKAREREITTAECEIVSAELPKKRRDESGCRRCRRTFRCDIE